MQLRTSGRAKIAESPTLVRELTVDDLTALATERGAHQPGQTLTRIRDSHHDVAKCFAEGMTNFEVQIATGYSSSRISILKQDPSFQELVEHYRHVKTEATADLAVRMKSLSLDALEELRERMHTEDLAPEMLLDILKVTADRTGHGPTNKVTQTNVNVNLADLLREARERVRPVPPLIEGKPNDR